MQGNRYTMWITEAGFLIAVSQFNRLRKTRSYSHQDLTVNLLIKGQGIYHNQLQPWRHIPLSFPQQWCFCNGNKLRSSSQYDLKIQILSLQRISSTTRKSWKVNMTAIRHQCGIKYSCSRKTKRFWPQNKMMKTSNLQWNYKNNTVIITTSKSHMSYRK